MSLLKYKSKRDLKISKEPEALVKKSRSKKLIFVIQKHHAKRLHYDLRLQVQGVLKSWAIPKEPSSRSDVKRLAIMVEDHPYSYKDFEGVIPSGYGAGSVSIWDRGTYCIEGVKTKDLEKKIQEGLKKGELHLYLKGEKLKGVFHLIRLKNSNNQWLFIKGKESGEKSLRTPKDLSFLTNLEKPFWPKEGLTKKDLLSYYAKVSCWILPHLKDRPQTLRRFPNGIEGDSFFHKNLVQHPAWIETVKISHEKKPVHYLLIQDLESLLFAANLGGIELHPFFSRVQKLQCPDCIVLDLDPKGASFHHVIQIAQAIHRLLEEVNVPSYCKTSGASGLHVAIPLGGKYPYEIARKFAELIATIIHQRTASISTLERSISKRQGKVYIDYLRNYFGQTLAAPYSVRAQPGATVSTPLTWKEVKKGLDPKNYTMQNIFPRLKKMGDLYAGVLKKGIHLPTVLKKMQSIQKTEKRLVTS